MNIDNITSDKIGLSINGMQMQIKLYEQEIERLKDLCDKYEEEHKTTFETWKKQIEENSDLKSRIDKALLYITWHIPDCNDLVNILKEGK